MMFDVSINGRSWRIGVEAAEEPGQFRVTVKGRQQVVNAVWIDPGTLSLLVGDTTVPGGQPYAVREIGIHDAAPGEFDVLVGGELFRTAVSVAGGATLRRSQGIDAAGSGGEGRRSIVAPMPGRIVRVLVEPGDEVSAGQGVVIIEAMKMENELRSPKAGLVREIAAREGAAVEAGTVLAIVE